MGNSPTDSKKKVDSSPALPANASLPPQVSDAPSITDENPNADLSNTSTVYISRPALDSSIDQVFADAFLPESLVNPHLLAEPNPFEHSFAGGGESGPTKLPSVAALTSPASLLAGTGTTPYPWGPGSLRTGPLSPAMLSGPTNDYFGDSHLRGGFPTPNESSMRTGLTPGGGGSMFPQPQPSPNSAAIFAQLQSGGATPSTLDFHRTAMSAAAAAQKRNHQQSITSQPQDLLNGIDTKPLQNTQGELFGQHDANDAANGLFMLASQSRNGSQGVNQYQIAQPQTVHAHPMANSNEASPTMANRNQNGSLSTASGRGLSEISDESEQHRPNTRGKGKKGGAANGRRKAEEPPVKAPATKKSKANNGNANSSMMEPEPQSEEELDMSKDEYNANGKKMTDEEKRKNFLERNRVAALKCRQRKKQWLANLQNKVEMYSSENDALSAQLTSLRDEVVNLKTLLLAHKDCPITQQQGLQGQLHMQMMGDYGSQMQNPYGMAMNGQHIMAGQNMQRRYS